MAKRVDGGKRGSRTVNHPPAPKQRGGHDYQDGVRISGRAIALGIPASEATDRAIQGLAKRVRKVA